MRSILRLLHRVIGHRWEPATLTLGGVQFRGRCCRCGVVDEALWELLGGQTR